MPVTRALRAALAEAWAITDEGLDLVLAVAARENAASMDIEALEAYRAEHVPTSERLYARGPLAIMEVRGPLVSRANLFTAVSGATSYDILRRDLQSALDNASYQAIIMKFDTPGGSVTGVDELAKAIHDGKAKKPIYAYVEGAAASAGYWLASQATEIIVADTAILGSIGVRQTLRDTSKKDAEAGILEFISSRAPGKRTDLSSDEGRASIQRTIDALEGVFLSTVAKGRRVKVDDVIAKFGGGGIVVGSDAIAAGMADRLGTFEGLVTELAGRGPKPFNSKRNAKVENEQIEAARKEGEKLGATAERTRIQAILSLPEAKGRETSAMHLALMTELTADVAKGVLSGVAVAAVEPTGDEQEKPRGLRSHEAVGGLVQYDPSADNPPSKSEKMKASWGKVVGNINAHM